MPRQARIDAPNALHHIIVRGIERRNIFHDDRDRSSFLERLGGILLETSTSCYAWALLPNHLHLCLRTGTHPIATVMRRLLTGYAVTFNRRHRRHGHLFQNRYKSILCQEDPYLLQLVRYIHLNPLRAHLVKDLKELNSYPYGGHSFILGKRKNDWQDIKYILAFFNRKMAAARRQYRAYVEEGIAQGRRPDLVGGGLIRSLGGWEKIKTLRRKDMRLKGDERILGDTDFVLAVLEESEERLERRYELEVQGVNLDDVARRAASLFEIEPKEIYTSGKQSSLVGARSLFCYWAVRELGKSATALARMLKLSQPAVSISVKRGERIARDKKFELLLR
jgi:putative transposase